MTGTVRRAAWPYHRWRARRRGRRVLAALPARGLCVNLGCGWRPLKGWVNLDRELVPDVDVVWDLREGLPFPTGSCACLLGEHVIEHLSKAEATELVRECRRVLEPGGTLRLSTPDAGRYLRSYAAGDDFLRHPAFPHEAETPMDRINHMMREDGLHLWVYDSESLRRLLTAVGFAEVQETRFGESADAHLRGIDHPDREFESLYVEAVV